MMFAIAFSFAAQIVVFSATKQNAVGVVYGANGPLAGAYVSAKGDSGSASATTDSQGHYTMSKGLKTGTYNVTASGTGYVTGEVDLVGVTAGQTTTGINIDLQLSGAISGMVTDAVNGNPLNGTYVFASLANGTTSYEGFATTGTNGKYLMATDLPTGTYNVTVELAPAGYIRQSTTANVVAGVETKNVNIPLARSGIISGTITQPDGTPLSGISVTAYVSSFLYYGLATTDSSGNYRIATGLGTGAYTVVASGDGAYNSTYPLLYPTGVMVTAGVETTGVNMELTPVTIPPTESGIITGRVTDQSNGNPIEFATVTAQDSGYGSAETDSNGYYNISTGLSTDTDYNVSATVSGYYDAYYQTLVTVTVGQTTSDINIPMTPVPAQTYGTITGTVTGAPNPIPEFQYYPMIAMLSLTLVAAVAGRLMLKTKRYKNATIAQ